MDVKEKKPGMLSEELKAALGMQGIMPPPWLINMQRYGPPPSYPSLRIPGLNAPLPEGAAFGYHPGGWGKPPVDEYGRPLYGDVFGRQGGGLDAGDVAIDRTRWGEIVAGAADDVISDDDDNMGESSGESDDDSTARSAHRGVAGTDTPMDGVNSMVSGLETPDAIDLRKRAGVETPDTAPRELYHVIQEKSAHAAGSQIFGSEKTYVLPGASADQEEKLPSGTQSEAGRASEDDSARRKRKSENASGASSSKRHKDFKF